MVSNEKRSNHLFLNRSFSFELRFQSDWGVQALMIASKVVRNFMFVFFLLLLDFAHAINQSE